MSLKLHGHPQLAQYPDDWLPFVSGQGHWSDIPPGHEGHTHHVAHTHVEVWAPLWAEIPRHDPIVLRGRVQLFHTSGVVQNPHGYTLSRFVWDTPEPVVGDPAGVVVRYFTATFDPALSYQDGSGGPPKFRPENGWMSLQLGVYTQFDSGTRTLTEVFLPFYSKGDPSVPEEPADFILSARISAFGAIENHHGTSISEYKNVYLPILAPLTAAESVPAICYGYARSPEFDANFTVNDKALLMLDPDLHNGVPGTILRDYPLNTNPVVDFDPAEVGPGLHKFALVWKQSTGPTPPAPFVANQEMNALLVLNVAVGAGTPLPPGPPPSPPPLQVSPDGTTVPPAPYIVETPQRVWSLAPDGRVLLNGVPEAGGQGSILKICGGKLFVFYPPDGNWWEMYQSSPHGPNDPCTGGPPPMPGEPVDCAGSYGPWLEVSPGLWRQEFTVTQPPANGGKSCAVVVNGG